TAAVRDAYEGMPLLFVENRGQVDERVRYYEQNRDHAAAFTADGLWLSLRAHGQAAAGRTVRLAPVGGNPAPEIVPEQPQAVRIHSFLGEDPARWKSELSTYAAVRYAQVYPGVDLRFYGKGRELEYDVIVQPGADPSAVR